MFAACALAAGLVAISGGQAMASPGLKDEPCPSDYLCAYEEEQFYGEMSKVKVTDPDMTDEADRHIFRDHVESLVHNNSCKAHLYEKKNFEGEEAVLAFGGKIKDIKLRHLALKHPILSVKSEC
ncbi:hypothetical protein GCM10018954_007540 [Kutzneria kofuensis]